MYKCLRSRAHAGRQRSTGDFSLERNMCRFTISMLVMYYYYSINVMIIISLERKMG